MKLSPFLKLSFNSISYDQKKLYDVGITTLKGLSKKPAPSIRIQEDGAPSRISLMPFDTQQQKAS